jgi:HlyD family secretion protein
MSARWRRGLGIAAGVMAAAGVAWGVALARARGAAPPEPLASARRGEFLVTLTVRGQIAAGRSVEVTAPDISGLRITWLAPRGSIVQTGAPVARFDSSTARQSLATKTAALRQAEASLAQAQATARIAAQQDALDLATDRNAVASARLDAAKAAILSPIDGAESRLALGMAEEKLTVEQATMAAHRASNAAKIASARRLRDKARADWARIERQLRQMQIDAPLTGAVNYLTNYSQGWLNAQPFKVGDSVWPEATLAEIPDLATLRLTTGVSEVQRGEVAVGDVVRMHPDSLPELTLTGRIRSIAPLAEPDFSSTFPPPQLFHIVARLDHIDPRLRPGMTGSLDVVTRKLPEAIIVPARAIFTVGGRPVVYVFAGGRYHRTPITVVARTADQAAIGGLAAGARVALADPTAAAPGGRS